MNARQYIFHVAKPMLINTMHFIRYGIGDLLAEKRQGKFKGEITRILWQEITAFIEQDSIGKDEYHRRTLNDVKEILIGLLDEDLGYGRDVLARLINFMVKRGTWDEIKAIAKRTVKEE
ncbi:MAG: hypothetical protein DRP01_03095 [Archaeoglobales archaeon]|nr:MAG: hypothetical protein DRP01_03095 [Archaeoglobales archaeon]